MPPARLTLYAATAGVLAAAAYAIVRHPPPFVWAALMLLGYLALILGGVFILRWRVFVDAVIRGPRDARGVALTFDDGPHPRWTPRVLDLLAKHGVTATFFVVGHKVEAYPDVVRAILQAGHTVGTHSYAHDRLLSLRGERTVRADLERAVTVLENVSGHRPWLFRPPVGYTNPTIARVADALGLTVVGWTIGARDGIARALPEAVVARVRPKLRDGAIVLLHDSPEHGDREPAALRALPAILDAIAARRLEVVPVTRWLADSAP